MMMVFYLGKNLLHTEEQRTRQSYRGCGACRLPTSHDGRHVATRSDSAAGASSPQPPVSTSTAPSSLRRTSSNCARARPPRAAPRRPRGRGRAPLPESRPRVPSLCSTRGRRRRSAPVPLLARLARPRVVGEPRRRLRRAFAGRPATVFLASPRAPGPRAACRGSLASSRGVGGGGDGRCGVVGEARSAGRINRFPAAASSARRHLFGRRAGRLGRAAAAAFEAASLARWYLETFLSFALTS